MKTVLIFLALLGVSLGNEASLAKPVSKTEHYSFFQNNLNQNPQNFKDILEKWVKLMDQFTSECLCETKANPALAAKIYKNLDFTNDPCLKCKIKCTFQKLGFIDDNAKIYTIIINKKMAGVTIEIAKECAELFKKELDPCEKAFRVAICIANKVANAHGVKIPLP